MSEWIVSLDMRVDSLPTEHELDALLDVCADLLDGPALSIGRDRVSVTTSADGDDAAEALAQAEHDFRRCLAQAWRPEAILEAAEVLTFEEQDRRLAEPAFPPLAGVAEVAAMLEVSRQRVSQLASQGGFPTPVARLAAGPVWREGDLSTFLKDWKRQPGRPRKAG